MSEGNGSSRRPAGGRRVVRQVPLDAVKDVGVRQVLMVMREDAERLARRVAVLERERRNRN